MKIEDGLQISEAEENNSLLFLLMKKCFAEGFGDICNFFEVTPRWRCPCCFRSKEEIVSVDNNGCLVCSINEHKDSLSNLIDMVPFGIHDVESRSAIQRSFERFSPTLICADCIVAEATAKQASRTPPAFSFAIHEIAGFIQVEANLPHKVDGRKALLTYEALKEPLKMLGDRIRAIREAVRVEGAGFEPVGAAAWRVIAAVRAKMDGGSNG